MARTKHHTVTGRRGWLGLTAWALASTVASTHVGAVEADRGKHARDEIPAAPDRSFLYAYGIDPDRERWIPVAGAPGAWRRVGSPWDVQLRGGDTCPPFVFRHGFESGALSQDGGAGSPITYVSGGGYTVKIDRHTITITDPIGRNTVQHWGDPHENLNGKHLKDWAGASGWDGSRRSVLMGDGSKITMTATGPHGLVGQTSIYDDGTNVQFVNASNLVVHHGIDPIDAQTRDDAQHDGETALFETSAVTGIATYTNIYNEDAVFNRMPFDVPLGTTGGCANPNQVNDLFDDPRLGHT